MWQQNYTLNGRYTFYIKLSAIVCNNKQVKKYFITFAAIAILGMIVIYYGPTAFKSDDAQNTPSTTASNTIASAQPSNPSASTSSTNPSSQPNTPTPTQNPSYKDGTYTGKDFQNPYGDVQISIVISSGKITSVNLLNMPSAEQRSKYLTSMAGPLLKSQTINAQSAQIDGVSGATYTSQSYQQSLQSALDQAKTA